MNVVEKKVSRFRGNFNFRHQQMAPLQQFLIYGVDIDVLVNISDVINTAIGRR